MKSRQVTALVLGMFVLLGQFDTVCCDGEDGKGKGINWKKHLKCSMAVAAAGVATIYGGPYVLGAVGFTAVGITAGSLAAKAMSVSAVASGGGVTAGGIVATLQSAGVLGVGKAVVGAVATGTAYLCNTLFGEEEDSP